MAKREDIQKAVANPDWQRFREGLKGLPADEKLQHLQNYKNTHGHSAESITQTENYENALRRAGQHPDQKKEKP